MSERFWSKVDRSGECWMWTAHTRRGYGRFYANGAYVQAHRFSYELANGPIPVGLVIDHICRNKGCVRPEHLRAVTQRENLLYGPTIIAAEVARIECPNGHPLSGDNLRITPQGWRECMTCARARWRRHTPKETARRSALRRARRLARETGERR